MVGAIDTQELLQDKRTLLPFWWAGECSALNNVSGLKACALYHMKYKYCKDLYLIESYTAADETPQILKDATGKTRLCI